MNCDYCHLCGVKFIFINIYINSLSSEPLDSSKRLNTSMFTDDELTTDDSDDDLDVRYNF
jgi:hypothetical protein